ncbi:MAG: hypothetical protein AAAB35_18755 [Phyllobacterium sp.]|uniref:hypothetical protein n=1 Tax=Phyllobacterium sp. TaxID=1871046 RepID=UPI0030F1601B
MKKRKSKYDKLDPLEQWKADIKAKAKNRSDNRKHRIEQRKGEDRELARRLQKYGCV